MEIENLTVRIRNFKCFGEDDQGFERLLPINLIIGRNNSGKSTLLDILDYLTGPKDLTPLGHRGALPRIILSRALAHSELEFSLGRVVQNPSGSTAPSKYMAEWEGRPFVWEVKSDSSLGSSL
jgi:putative ATP-dependent endonuclease of OLD family